MTEPSVTIKGIYCTPVVPGEDGAGYSVGAKNVGRIERREENLGTYGILWYDVYTFNDQLIASLNAMGVSEIIYAK